MQILFYIWSCTYKAVAKKHEVMLQVSWHYLYPETFSLKLLILPGETIYSCFIMDPEWFVLEEYVRRPFILDVIKQEAISEFLLWFVWYWDDKAENLMSYRKIYNAWTERSDADQTQQGGVGIMCNCP